MCVDKLKTFSTCLVFLVCFVCGNAQNMPYVDEKPIRFGFTLGLNTMDFRTYENLQAIDGKIYSAEVSQLKPGFSVGVITDLRLHNYLNLRFIPTLHFGERELTYRAQGESETSVVSVPSVPIYVPIYLKYSAQRANNYRPYLIGGVGASLDLGRDTELPIMLKPFDFFAEVGVGCDLYFSFFKLSPELKFSLGFSDILTSLDERSSGFVSDNDKKYTNAMSKLMSRMLTLTFNFE